MAVLQAEGIWVEKAAPGDPGALPLLRGIDLDLPEGEITVLLGETGAGKTLLAKTLAGLLPDGLRLARGRIIFRGRALDFPGDWAGVRGPGIFYAPQNAAASFNPVLTIGRQIGECSRITECEVEERLASLCFADPGRILRSYPHALSGGENQRCLLVLALAACPDVLIMDEPTSEIDAVAHDEFIRVLLEYQRRRSLTVLLISHHLGFVRDIAAKLCIMYRGEMIAAGDPQAVLASPDHPYAREIADYMEAE